jgi:hypothetical protein
MNNQEAKFILGAHRPGGQDAGDPMFTAALAHAEREPELRAWLEQQRKFDLNVAAKLKEIAPPAGLHAAILAGVRASQPKRRWWMNPAWMAAAAAVAVLVAVGVAPRKSTRTPTVAQLTEWVMKDLADAHDAHVGYPPEFAGLQAALASVSLPLTTPGAVRVDLDELRRKNCRSVMIAGREVFEICFQRDGVWFHLYAARRSDFAPGAVDAKSLLATTGEYSATAWADSKNVYALVIHAGQEVLRRVI